MSGKTSRRPGKSGPLNDLSATVSHNRGDVEELGGFREPDRVVSQVLNRLRAHRKGHLDLMVDENQRVVVVVEKLFRCKRRVVDSVLGHCCGRR